MGAGRVPSCRNRTWLSLADGAICTVEVPEVGLCRGGHQAAVAEPWSGQACRAKDVGRAWLLADEETWCYI